MCHCDWLERQARELAGPGMSAAFRYGSVRIPMDSYATEVLVRSADGSLWLLVHDVMIDGEAPQFWVQRCGKLRFKADYSGYLIEGCKVEEEAKS